MATAPNWDQIGGGTPRFALKTTNDYNRFRTIAETMPGSKEAQAVAALGSVEAVFAANEAYNKQYADYLASFYGDVAERIPSSPAFAAKAEETAQAAADFDAKQAEVKKYVVTDAMLKQAEKDPYYAKQLQDPELFKLLIDNPQVALNLRNQDRGERVNKIRSELENQYNNLVSAGQQQGQDLSYQGRKSDLPKIFEVQATQLADGGVTSIADLKIQNGQLINSATGKVVTNSNLNGQVYNDRDTGVQKWGDIFSGVRGGANYGIQALGDGSVVLFPAYEKTKSPIAQIGLGGLENIIAPVLTVAGAYFGVPGLGNVAGAAAGAAAGSTAGQLLASGNVDWEKVALSAGVAGGAAALAGAGAGATADLSGTTTGGMLGSDAGFAVAEGVGGAAAGGGLFGDASFIAQDAAGQAAQGLSAGQISQNLVAAGVDPGSAQLAANLATSGTGAASIANTLATMAPASAGGLFTATAADLAAAGITTGGTGIALSPAQLSAIQRGEIPGATFAEQVENAKFILPDAGGATTGAGAVKDLLSTGGNALTDIFGSGGIGGFLTGLAGAGIDYAALQAISNEAQTLGREAEQRATAAGAAANIPFTPYTVTTGAGTTAFGGTREAPTATVTASPEYEALRQQAIAQSGQALGTINPAQAAESLFQRSEALAAPARQRETEQLLSSLGARGLLGVSTNVPTVGGTVAGVNPYLESLASAQRTAQARTALEAQQFGTVEAQRQAALANTLIGTGQGIDTAALGTLTQGANLGQVATAANQAGAAQQLRATLAGQALRQQYEDLGLRAQAQGYLGAADFGRGMLGLPTQAGNTASTNIVGNLLNRGFDYIFS